VEAVKPFNWATDDDDLAYDTAELAAIEADHPWLMWNDIAIHPPTIIPIETNTGAIRAPIDPLFPRHHRGRGGDGPSAA
jgi:hypothetical protein